MITVAAEPNDNLPRPKDDEIKELQRRQEELLQRISNRMPRSERLRPEIHAELANITYQLGTLKAG